MDSSPGNPHHTDRVVLLFVAALFVLISPFKLWWTGANSPWYAPYLVWLVLIGLGWWLQHRRDRREL